MRMVFSTTTTYIENKRYGCYGHEKVDENDGNNIRENMAEEPLEKGLQDRFVGIGLF